MFIQLVEAARLTGAAKLDHLADATLLLDGAGKVLLANAASSALLQEGACLAITNGVLAARRRNENAVLRRMITLAADGIDGFCTLRRPAGALPVQVMLLSLPDARVLVRLVAPGHRAGLPETAMRRSFGLTAREAELAVRFAEGSTLAEAAALMGLTLPQAHALQAHVLTKTGATSPAGIGKLLDTIL